MTSRNSPPLGHVPALVPELISELGVKRNGRYVDCTLGGAGHAIAVLEASAPRGSLLGLDADPAAIALATKRLQPWAGRCTLANRNFAELQAACSEYGYLNVHAVYFDLGLSSIQLDTAGRGFSFQHEAPLDMRFSPRQDRTADDLVNHASADDLANVLFEFGEETRSRAIARRIVASRPVGTTMQLARIVASAVRGGHERIHPATKTFQALRIWVNDELAVLRSALAQATQVVKHGGRIGVIAWHSLEDRIVKQWFQQESRDCICPPELPVCVCGHKATVKTLTRRPIVPSEAEIQRNPRSRSAKLRVAEKL